MKTIRIIFTLLIAAVSMTFTQQLMAQEAPDALIKRISEEVLDTAKTDKKIQAGDKKSVRDLVDAKILPYVDFERMTVLAAGSEWQKATPEQQKQLTGEFRALIIHTYSGAISQIKDQKVVVRPLRSAAGSADVEVMTEVAQPRGEPLQLNYRLEKLPDGWKIYDISIFGAWLVATYKNTFASEISKDGIDGLIKLLSDKNKNLANNTAGDS